MLAEAAGRQCTMRIPVTDRHVAHCGTRREHGYASVVWCVRCDQGAMAGAVASPEARPRLRGAASCPVAPYWVGLDQQAFGAQFAELRQWADAVLRKHYCGYELRDCWPSHIHAIWELSTLAAAPGDGPALADSHSIPLGLRS